MQQAGILCVVLIGIATWFQYNATYFATYVESGVRRITLAEQLRKIPLSFFGKKDLADLTSTIMAGLQLFGAELLPFHSGACRDRWSPRCSLQSASFSLTADGAGSAVGASHLLCHRRAVRQGPGNGLNQKAMDAKMACADGIQECIETVQDLKANNARMSICPGWKTRSGAWRSAPSSMNSGLPPLWSTASLILKLGIASVALVGSILLIQGTLDVLTFFLFLLVVSRFYDPLQGALQNLAAVISTRTNIAPHE